MACKRAVRAGDVIVQIPRHLLVTARDVMNGCIGELVIGY